MRDRTEARPEHRQAVSQTVRLIKASPTLNLPLLTIIPAVDTQRKKPKCHVLKLCFLITKKKIQLLLPLAYLINSLKAMVIKATRMPFLFAVSVLDKAVTSQGAWQTTVLPERSIRLHFVFVEIP